MSVPVLQQLMDTIESRRTQSSDRSYTATLLAGGVSKMGDKVIEEASELVEAALQQDRDADTRTEHIAAEAADLLYHVLVLLAGCNLSLADVERVLASRFGISGLHEKAARKNPSIE